MSIGQCSEVWMTLGARHRDPKSKKVERTVYLAAQNPVHWKTEENKHSEGNPDKEGASLNQKQDSEAHIYNTLWVQNPVHWKIEENKHSEGNYNREVDSSQGSDEATEAIELEDLMPKAKTQSKNKTNFSRLEPNMVEMGRLQMLKWGALKPLPKGSHITASWILYWS
ncbi:hypothetical protein DFH08DRAFT_828542 [Mycena albidolilacea]|uniref:Uncharacterized protein n=1 Tax=Mycena albidolilacea TaxID=1033008 RepID=A0AAD6YW38_9AGAR|nr:hypothetical protein DFH08DRAFT_828542 [Mycena albidolilacea]